MALWLKECSGHQLSATLGKSLPLRAQNSAYHCDPRLWATGALPMPQAPLITLTQPLYPKVQYVLPSNCDPNPTLLTLPKSGPP